MLVSERRIRVATDMVIVRVMGPMKVAVVGAPSYFAQRRRRADR